MGIRHLITFLQPYAIAESLAGQKVVIDGPAFAHHVYYTCLGARDGARNTFEAAPSYEEIGFAALAWLERLRGSGCTIPRIYFDGYLPPSKLPTRQARLEAHSNRLSQYREQNPIPCRASSPRQKKTPPSLFSSTARGRKSLTILPPLPFLVPAVIEALLEAHEYHDAVEVVPGEADIYCAQYLKSHGGVVITGDSDLLVHDLGNDGAVSFFENISPADDPGTLKTMIYRPAAIVRRLSLPESHGVPALAFEMTLDNYLSFPEVLRRAQALLGVTEHSTEFKEFLSEYTSLPDQAAFDSEGNATRCILKALDPRISEYALQFPKLSQIAGQAQLISTAESEIPHIFLPFLTDNPVRTTAWETSAPIRQLAYGLISLIVPEEQHKSTVFEHRKRQNKSSGRELELPSIQSLDGLCLDIVKMLEQVRDKLTEASESDLWLAIAVFQDMEWAHAQSKVATIISAKQEITRENPSEDLSWNTVQFFAQVQASYYSFRILKQVISLVDSQDSLTPSITLLQTHLQALPVLCDLQDFSHASAIIQLVGSTKMVEVTQEILGIKQIQEPQTIPKVSKKKRKRIQAAVEDTSGHKKSSNPFELLALE